MYKNYGRNLKKQIMILIIYLKIFKIMMKNLNKIKIKKRYNKKNKQL